MIIDQLKSGLKMLQTFTVKRDRPKILRFNIGDSTSCFFYGSKAKEAMCVILHALVKTERANYTQKNLGKEGYEKKVMILGGY